MNKEKEIEELIEEMDHERQVKMLLAEREELTGIIVQMQADIERVIIEREEARAVCRGVMRAVKDYLEK